MPTMNQLIRKPRKSRESKSESPALNKGYNTQKRKQTNGIFSTKTWCLYACWNNDT